MSGLTVGQALDAAATLGYLAEDLTVGADRIRAHARAFACRDAYRVSSDLQQLVERLAAAATRLEEMVKP